MSPLPRVRRPASADPIQGDPPAWESFGAGTGNPDDHLHDGVIALDHADGGWPHWHEEPDGRYVAWTSHPDWPPKQPAQAAENGPPDPEATTRVSRLTNPPVSPLAGKKWFGHDNPPEEPPMPTAGTPAREPYDPPTVSGPRPLRPDAAESQQRHPAGRDLAVPDDRERANLKAAGAAEVGKAILGYALPAAQEEYALRLAEAQNHGFEAGRLLGRIMTVLTVERELADDDDVRDFYRVARSLLVSHDLDED